MKNNFFKFWRGKVLPVFLMDFIFFSFLLWFFVYARNRIFSYLVALQQFAPQLSDIASSLDANNPLGISQLDALLNVVNPIISEAKLFVYLIIPLVVFMFWVFFQGISWSVLFNDSLRKSFNLKFYFPFSLLSLPFFVLLFYFVSQLLFSESLSGSVLILSLVGLLLLLCLTITSYLVSPFSFSGFYKLILKKFYILFPLFLVFTFFLILVSVAFLDVYIYILSLTLPSLVSILFFVFFIFLFSSSKSVLAFFSK